MTESVLNEKLLQTFQLCDLHIRRMRYSSSKIEPFLPLNRDNYYSLDDDTIGFLDQFIFRFSKLQDLIGARLFPLILEYLAEPVVDKAFIDILNRLEKIGILHSAQNWIELRKIRNEITHEYPTSLNERIAGINILFNQWEEMSKVVINCRSVYESYKSKD